MPLPRNGEVMPKPRITIIGLGLIGGSIGLALQKVKTNFEIVGHDREHSIAGRAHKLGAIDRTEWNLISAVEGADLIIIATPVMAIREVFAAIAPYLRPDCIVTDTASTKQQVMGWAQEMLSETVSFVGGDPMVSKGESGIEAADADLFVDAVYCLTPLPSAKPEAVKLLVDLVSLIGARPYFLDAAEHDGLVAGVNHLPFILSTALVNATAQSPSWREMRKLTSYAFRNATHLAPGDPATYRDICLTNRRSIVRWIDTYLESLKELREAVAAEDTEGLEGIFKETLVAREEWLRGGQEDLWGAPTEAVRPPRRGLLLGRIG